MAKITHVKVWGFQSVNDVEYEVSTALTVFTGNSGQGKTAATMRAIRWVATGQPKGEDFIHKVYAPDKVSVLYEAKEAGVQITLDDGRVIRKTRSKGKTRYWLEPDYSEPFEKAEVPQVIKEALGIKSTSFGDLEFDLNFAYQLDPPFLISYPASAGAKVLGKLAGTEAVDGAIKSVAKDTYGARQKLSEAEKTRERRAEQLLEYQDLETIESDLDKAKLLIEWVESNLSSRDQLTELIGAFRRAQEQVESKRVLLDRYAVVISSESALLAADEAFQTFDHLQNLHRSAQGITTKLIELEHTISQYSHLELAEYSLQQAEEARVKKAQHMHLMMNLENILLEKHKANVRLEGTEHLEKVPEHLERAALAAQERQELNMLYQAGLTLQRENERLSAILDRQVEAGHAHGHIEAAAVAWNHCTELQVLEMSYQRKHDSAINFQEQEASSARRVEDAQRELDQAWEATGGLCPLCEQPLSAAHSH